MTSVNGDSVRQALEVRIEQCLQHTAAATTADDARVAVDALLAEHHCSVDMLALLLRELLVGIFHGFPSLPTSDAARMRLLSRESDISSTDYVRQWPSRIGTVPPPAEMPGRNANHVSPSRAICIEERSDSSHSSQSSKDATSVSSDENKEEWSAALHSHASATHQDLFNALMQASPITENKVIVSDIPSEPSQLSPPAHDISDDIVINKDDEELNHSYQVEMQPSASTPSALNALELRYILENVFSIVLRDVAGVFDVAILNEIYSTLLLSLSRVGADTENTALASELYTILLLFNEADVDESSSIMMDMVESIIYEHLLTPSAANAAASEDYEHKRHTESPINDSISSSSSDTDSGGNPQMGSMSENNSESSDDEQSSTSSSGSNGSEGVHAWDMPKSPLGFRRRIGGFGMPFRLPSLEADEGDSHDQIHRSNSNGSGFMAPAGDNSSSNEEDSLDDSAAIADTSDCDNGVVIDTNDINVHDLPADFGFELLDDINSPTTAASLDDDFDNLIVLHGVTSDLNKIISPRTSPEACLHRKRSNSGSSSNNSASKTMHIDVTVPTLIVPDDVGTPLASPNKASPRSPTVLVSPSKAKTFLTEFKEEDSSSDDDMIDVVDPLHFPAVRDTSTAAMYDALLQRSAGADSDIVTSFRHIVQQYSNQLYPYEVHSMSDEEAAAHMPMTTDEIAARVHLSSEKGKKSNKKNTVKKRPKSAFTRPHPRTASAGASTMRKLSLYSLDTDAYEVLQSPRRRKKRSYKTKRSNSSGNLFTPTASSSAKTAASRLTRSVSSDRGQWLGI